MLPGLPDWYIPPSRLGNYLRPSELDVGAVAFDMTTAATMGVVTVWQVNLESRVLEPLEVRK